MPIWPLPKPTAALDYERPWNFFLTWIKQNSKEHLVFLQVTTTTTTTTITTKGRRLVGAGLPLHSAPSPTCWSLRPPSPPTLNSPVINRQLLNPRNICHLWKFDGTTDENRNYFYFNLVQQYYIVSNTLVCHLQANTATLKNKKVAVEEKSV